MVIVFISISKKALPGENQALKKGVTLPHTYSMNQKNRMAVMLAQFEEF